jgi:ankyrin repeat protein
MKTKESDNIIKQSDESLLANELIDLCESDSLSKDGLRKIFERHGFMLLSPYTPKINNYDFFFEACYNERVTEGIIRYILEYFPDASSAADDIGYTPLHYACGNKNITLNIVQLLIDAAPNSVRSVDSTSWMPLHYLCKNEDVDEIAAMEILKLLLEKCPEALRHAAHNGFLPLHAACMSRSPEFCCTLMEAYPGSERITDRDGMLPLHYACMYNRVATVEYLYKLYPDAINHTPTPDGGHPILIAIHSMNLRDNPAAAVDIVKCLLDCDPSVKLQKYRGRLSLLRFACHWEYNDSNIEAALKVINLLYDAHPEAIDDNRIISNVHRYHPQVQTFINSQLVYSRQAKDHRLMTTPDEKGRLPLHIALQNNVRLGSIKLLVKANHTAVKSPDHSRALPLHLACQHNEYASVIQYLLGLDAATLRAVDDKDNTALHYACSGTKYDTIALLLEKYNAISVSKRNAHKKLPIDLLFESSDVLDRESTEYTESVFRLLGAYPETVMNFIM